jgi:CelD/BcsL family acetyltransferase involved in cellulose biosynthesis
MEGLQFTVIEDTGGLRELRKLWSDILEDSVASVFSSWEWLFTWWEYYGGDRRLFILVLLLHDKPVAIFPHFISTRKSLFSRRLNVIHTIGQDYTASDYLDFIIRRGMEGPAVSFWIRYLLARKQEWTFIELKEIARESTLYPILVDTAREVGVIVHESIKDRCPRAAVDPLQYARKMRESKTLRRLAEYERSFSRQCRYQFGTGLLDDNFDETFRIFLTLHEQRSKRTERLTKLTTPPFSDFLRSASRRLLDAGRLLFTWISVGDRIAAIHLNFVMNRRLYYYNAGMDERWAKHRVGLILFHREMLQAQSWGIDEYLFLRGTEDYKYFWADREDHLMLAHFTQKGMKRLCLSADFFLKSLWGRLDVDE